MKFIKVAELRDLEARLMNEEISYSRMVEIINEMAYEYYIEKLKNETNTQNPKR